MRVAIYTRVSSQEQIDGYSLDAQRRICEQFAESRRWEIVEVYQEPGRSGRSAHRPVFQRMIQDAGAGLFDVILVHKLDRFSRSLLDVLTYLGKLSEHDVSFVSASEQFDFSTPFGKVILAMLAAFAQWYTDNLASEIRKGKRERARQGGWNGRLSFGYTTPARINARLLTDLSEDEADKLEASLDQYTNLDETAAVPCPIDAPGVRLAFELYATGSYSDEQTAAALDEAGHRSTTGRTFTAATVRDLLTNRFYLGETSYKGGKGGRSSRKLRKWLPGAHEALVSPELFGAVQQQRAARAKQYGRNYARTKRYYPLGGLLIDECGIAYRGQYKHGRRYYRQRQERAKQAGCEIERTYLRADDLENHVRVALKELVIPEQWFHQAREQSREISYRVDEAALLAKLDRIKKLYIEGDMTESEYDALRDEIREKLNQPEPTVIVNPVEIERTYALINNVGELWDAATDEERVELLGYLFHRVELENGKVRTIIPTPILSVMMFGVTDGEDRYSSRQWSRNFPSFSPYPMAA